MKKVLLFLLMLGILVSLLCGCKSDEVMIEDRMNDFLNAFNSGDMEAVLDCYDAKTRNANKSLLNIGNGLLGMSGIEFGLADIFGLTVGLVSNGDLLRVEDLQITINSSGTQAEVSATLYYMDVGESCDMPIQLTMIKENGDWFITP